MIGPLESLAPDFFEGARYVTRSLRRKIALLGCGLIVLGAACGAAAKDVGLAVGETAPRFTLEDQTGASRSFDSLLARGKLAVVFFRSADW